VKKRSTGLALVCLLATTAAAGAETAAPVATPAEQPYLSRYYLFVDSKEVQGYLDSVVQKLLATRKDKLQPPAVLVYSADAFAASSDDRNNILISTRTLRDLESEDELAALLSHELTHLLRGHNQRKGALRAFPVGVETAGWIAAAADQLMAKGHSGTSAGGLSGFSKDALVNTQAASMLWSDILTPGWNRSQEREADRGGYDMMVAAGYDPAAFGALFSKLQSAQARRSERMELLKKIAEDRLKRNAARQAAGDNGVIKQAGNKVKEKAEEISVDAVFDQLTSFNRDYDPPEQRQKLLADYADKHSSRSRDKTARSPRFRQLLREGRGGAMLAADRSALQLLANLNAGKLGEARKFMDAVKPSKPGTEPLSPHLNLALGSWYNASGDPAAGEQRAQAWLRSRRPPVQAYLWRASYQWNRKEYQQVLNTFEGGTKRTGSAAVFLPHLVTTAKAMGSNKKAEDYTRRCRDEDRKGSNAVFTLITFRGSVAPSGIYAECVQRLGHEPANDSLGSKLVKAPMRAGKSIGKKAKELFSKP
jgi:predicted Zn-dependent protease